LTVSEKDLALLENPRFKGKACWFGELIAGPYFDSTLVRTVRRNDFRRRGVVGATTEDDSPLYCPSPFFASCTKLKEAVVVFMDWASIGWEPTPRSLPRRKEIDLATFNGRSIHLCPLEVASAPASPNAECRWIDSDFALRMRR
jgi:hypothetical protein